MTDGGTETGASELDRKERLMSSSFVQLAPENERESGKLRLVKVVERREEVRSVASAETIGKFGEGEALTKQSELDLSVV